MSVIEFEPQVFYKFFITITASQNSDQYSRCVFDQCEDYYYQNICYNICNYDTQPEKRYAQAKRSMIYNWVNRLSIANQLASALTYNHGEDYCIKQLQEQPYGIIPYTTHEFHERLNSVRYNLFTNSGRCMFSHEDMNRLDNLIKTTSTILIEKLE